MDIVKLLQDLSASISNLTQQLLDAQSAVDAVAKTNYDAGFAAGVASVPAPTSDKIYSQVELDAAVALAVQPLQDQITSLNAQVMALRDQLNQMVADALATFKQDLLAKHQALVTALQDSETGFEQLLK